MINDGVTIIKDVCFTVSSKFPSFRAKLLVVFSTRLLQAPYDDTICFHLQCFADFKGISLRMRMVNVHMTSSR